MRMIVTLFIFLFSSNVLSLSDYLCEITGVFNVNSEGKVETNILKVFIGEKFSVNRLSGEMTGALDNKYVTDPVVINSGSEENSFQVVNTMKNDVTSNTYSLTIKEFTKENNKPFVFLRNSTVFYGICSHF